ncbi:MAG: sulfotransferase-like domain-containing protein [Brevirhabdus sp.]
MNIAMWSGPRNLSTAMMYSFGARADCDVWDEPFYAAYLAATGLDHPMGSAIVAAGETDPSDVSLACSRRAPGGQAHFYQKHMTHHMIPGFDRGFMGDCVNIFLIRHPARVVASYAVKREGPTLDDLGFRQQVELYEHALALGQTPVVVDSFDIRKTPQKTLSMLCKAIGIPFDPAMLGWPAGGHERDGVWAAHWYGAVHKSTGFAGKEGPLPKLDSAYAKLVEQALPHYHALAGKKTG